MANLKKSLRIPLDGLREAGRLNMDRFLEVCREAGLTLQSRETLSDDDVAMIVGAINTFLSEDRHGKTVKSLNMPVLTQKVANYIDCDLSQVATWEEKIASYVRTDRETFFVAKGRAAGGAGGVKILARLSAEEQKAVEDYRAAHEAASE